jgi:threonine/homoserine/homoserine lactone efflux protein
MLNTAIKHGSRAGSLLAIGVVLSDFVVCMLVVLGMSSFLETPKNQYYMGIGAGVVLIIFGAQHFRQPIKTAENAVQIKIPRTSDMIVKGFLLNSLNPTVWFLWLGNVAAVSPSLTNSIINMIVFFSITLGLVLAIEISKVYAAGKLKSFLTPKIMRGINIATGALLVLFGIGLICKHYFFTT